MGCAVEATCSPEVERKVIAASTVATSYQGASTLLKELSELEISPKQAERIARRVGGERVAEREEQLEAYERLSLPEQRTAPASAPQNSWDHRVATVSIDGGRAQLRDERWGQPHSPGERVSWWHEPKVALLSTFSSKAHNSDPIPEVPECLLDPLWVIPLINEIKGTKKGEGEIPATEKLVTQANQNEQPHWSPAPLVRSVVATFEPYEKLGRLAKMEAYHRGFAIAQRKAFLGDGHLSNWSIQERYFSGYTPIVDILHALSYVYQAAVNSTLDMEECWERCKTWITWTWQGEVRKIIDELTKLVEVETDQAKKEKLGESLTYLSNNQNRMHYDQYRTQGLPITTSQIESTVKQIGRRMKSSEKYWGPTAEPQLQLCADRISDTMPLEKYWQRRQAKQNGLRKSRAKVPKA